jgi:hypothetical protein
LCSLFVKHVGDAQVGERRKAVLRVTSKFTEPVDVTVEVEDPAKFFLEVEPRRFSLSPGESKELEVYLHPRRYDLIGYNIQSRIVFKASTPVAIEYREAIAVMNIYLIDHFETIISSAQEKAETEYAYTFTSETRIYKTFYTRNPYHVQLPITTVAEVAETEKLVIAIPPPIAEAPDVPLLDIVKPPTATIAPDTTISQTINSPELTYS